ncbi:MAG: hypothetical protein V3T72_06905, partial [Thermoanaerobaculia bacterium]
MHNAEHPDFDSLLSAAEGVAGAGSTARVHADSCETCRRRIAKLRGFLAAAADELLEMRSDCPHPDELAGLPPGAEHSDPHLRECPLCREEVRMLFELESERRLGFDLGGEAFFRPELLQRGGGAVVYQAPGEPAEMALEDGNDLEVRLGEALVRIKCEGGELVASVEGEIAGSLVLVLSDATLEKRSPLTADENRLPVEHWR